MVSTIPKETSLIGSWGVQSPVDLRSVLFVIQQTQPKLVLLPVTRWLLDKFFIYGIHSFGLHPSTFRWVKSPAPRDDALARTKSW